MFTLKNNYLSMSFLLVCVISSTSVIAEINLFSKPQGASAMGEALFSEEKTEKPAMRMRSISFGSAKKQKKAVQKDIQKAETVASNNNMKALALPIKFAVNSTTILNESLAYVDQVGEMLNMDKYKHKKLLIEGHTDASGSADLNFLLSYRRADAIKYYLISKHNIAPSRLSVDGKGENNPLSNTNPNAAVNRRVQLYDVK